MASLMKPGSWLGLDRLRPVGIEHFEEVAEALALGLQAELLVLLQGGAVEHRIVVEGDAVQAEVGAERTFLRLAVEMAALDMIERGGAEGQRRRCRIFAAADDVNVGGVVGAGGGRDGAVVEEPLVDGQHFAGAGGHEHDVHQLCFDDLRDDVAELGQGAIAQLAAVGLRRTAGGADGQGHVGVLGVGEDEVLAAVRVGVDAGQLEVERFLHYGDPQK